MMLEFTADIDGIQVNGIDMIHRSASVKSPRSKRCCDDSRHYPYRHSKTG
jgi:hypothetical protein